MTNLSPDQFGLSPANVKWNVIRGDTAELLVEFLENDETTAFDMSDWSFAATSYDFRGDVLDELEVEEVANGVKIIAPADITQFWGTGYGSVVAELAFDLQAVSGDRVWTPVIGTIRVSGDVTGGL